LIGLSTANAPFSLATGDRTTNFDPGDVGDDQQVLVLGIRNGLNPGCTNFRNVAFEESAAIEKIGIYHSPRSSITVSEIGLPEIWMLLTITFRSASERGGISEWWAGGIILPAAMRG